MSLQNKKIAFIGGGNMAEALISGLIRSRQARPSRILVAEPRAARRRQLKRRFGCRVTADNRELLPAAGLVVLAVKPQVIAEVLKDIAGELSKNHCVISIAAGIDTRYLQKHLGKQVRLIRAMPNTPALVGKGITGLFASGSARRSDLKLAEAFFASVGETIVFQRETALDWVTALSGSGPAYVFLFLEALIQGGSGGALSKQQAERLAFATAEGAIALAKDQKIELKTLRERVTSKGGTTEAALKVLKKKRWPEGLQEAIQAAAKRARMLRGLL